jgi:hypothetical protein
LGEPDSKSPFYESFWLTPSSLTFAVAFSFFYLLFDFKFPSLLILSSYFEAFFLLRLLSLPSLDLCCGELIIFILFD